MSVKPAGGTLILSMDFDRAGILSTAESRALVPFTREILQLLGSYKAVATFAATQVASSPSMEHVLADPAAHETALLVNRPAGAPEAALRQQAVRQSQAALAAGFQVTTLALCGGMHDADVELARRLGLSAVRSCGLSIQRSEQPKRSLLGGLFLALRGFPPQSAVARKVRHGLVEVPAAVVTPNAQGQFQGAASLSALKQIVTLASAEQQPMQLTFDVAAMLSNSHKSLLTLEHLLKQGAALRSSGTLQFATVATLAASALKQRQVVPSRSILKAA